MDLPQFRGLGAGVDSPTKAQGTASMKKRYIATLLTALQKLSQNGRRVKIRQVLECVRRKVPFSPSFSINKPPTTHQTC